MKTVIFDMDGVIFDTERVYTLAWDYAGEKAGIGKAGFMNMLTLGMSVDSSREIWRRQFGEGYDEATVRFFAREFVRDYFDKNGIPEKKGLRPLLLFLRENGWKTAVASSSPRSEVERNLSRAGIADFFDVVVCGDTVPHSKPEPDVYLKACELLREKPERCYAIEDSRNGIISACTAGCKVIMIPDLWECDHPTRKLLHALFVDLNEAREYLVEINEAERERRENEFEGFGELLFTEEETAAEEEYRDLGVSFDCLLLDGDEQDIGAGSEKDAAAVPPKAKPTGSAESFEIISYELSPPETQAALLTYLDGCIWGAGNFLAQLIRKGDFFVPDDRVFFMTDGGSVVSFLTLARTDCIEDDSMFPWIGFVFTEPAYRGRRNMGRLLAYAEERARERGFERLYLATDHIGLYEKYGFRYLKNMLDYQGEDSRIYVFEL